MLYTHLCCRQHASPTCKLPGGGPGGSPLRPALRRRGCCCCRRHGRCCKCCCHGPLSSCDGRGGGAEGHGSPGLCWGQALQAEGAIAMECSNAIWQWAHAMLPFGLPSACPHAAWAPGAALWCLGAPGERLQCEIGLRSVHTQQLRGRDQPCPAARVASRPSWITSSSASRACWAPRRRWAAQTSASAQIDGSDADLTPTLGFTGPACQRL